MQCPGCPLTNPPCASGVGNPHASIAIVGRNPGRTEARTGTPFTGPSGELLDATLAEIGLTRNDLWITNAVSCFVEDDDGPTKEMYELCRPRLIEELRTVDPKIVLSLGNEATQSLLGSQHGSITKLIGSMHHLTDFDTWVIPTFHPAYILRGNLGGFDDLKEALERAKKLSEGTTPMPAPLPYDKVHYYKTTDEISAQLYWIDENRKGPLAIDTETNFVRDPKRELLLLQLSDGVDAWVFEAEGLLKGDAYSNFYHMLQDPGYTWVFHNAAFDLQYLLHYWNTIPEHVEDTMMLALCLDERLQHAGLKRLVNTHLSVPHYETELSKYIVSKNTGYSAIPREVLVPYAGFDVIFTYRLLPVLKELVKKEGNEHLYPMLVETQKLFAEMAFKGVRVDLPYAEELKAEYYPLILSLEKELQAYAWGRGYRATEVVANAKDWPFLNPRSSKQLMYFLNKYCGLKTDTTDRKFMDRNKGHEFLEMLFRFRKIDHLMSTYVEGIEVEIWPDGKVHPDFLHGTVTGRISIQHPPLQTLPSSDFVEEFDVKSIRRLFVSEPGYVIVHSDYSQLEIRVAWHITGDEALGRAVMTKDMHRTMASAIYKKDPEDITEYERSMSKVVTFGMLYGRQAPSLATQMKISVQEAQSFLDKFSVQFPAYFQWCKEQQDKAVETGILSTEFGRRRRWSLITPDTEREIRNQAVNFPIQSTATDICMSSLIRISKEFRSRDWGRAMFSIHDSVELEVREECVHDAIELSTDIMTHPFTKTCATFKVKTSYGRNLEEASRE